MFMSYLFLTHISHNHKITAQKCVIYKPVYDFLLGNNKNVIKQENVTQLAFLGNLFDNQSMLDEVSLAVHLTIKYVTYT